MHSQQDNIIDVVMWFVLKQEEEPIHMDTMAHCHKRSTRNNTLLFEVTLLYVVLRTLTIPATTWLLLKTQQNY